MEILFEPHLMEIESGGFEETVFKIIKVEEHIVGIECRLRIALVPVEPLGTAKLQFGKPTDGEAQQVFLFG
jgi:hypothetical protein